MCTCKTKKGAFKLILYLGTHVDLSEDIKTFYAILENKRNRHDEDLKWSVSAMKKIDVAKVMGIDTN